MTESDTLTTATATGVLEARIANLRAALASVSARLGRLIDESKVGEHHMSPRVEDEIALVAAGAEMAVEDDERAAGKR